MRQTANCSIFIHSQGFLNLALRLEIESVTLATQVLSWPLIVYAIQRTQHQFEFQRGFLHSKSFFLCTILAHPQFHTCL